MSEGWETMELLPKTQLFNGKAVILKSDGNQEAFCKLDVHEAIITREVSDKVEEEMSRRAKRKSLS